MDPTQVTPAERASEQTSMAQSGQRTKTPAAANGETTRALLDEMMQTLRQQGADIVFGKTQEIGGQTIIPVAKAQVAFGFGLGRGGAGGQNEGEGGGGGGWVRTRPLGVIVVENGQVRFRPTFDVSAIATRALAVFAVIVVVRTIFRR